MQQQRHLAAILFTDIVGYTAIMQENEIKAVAMVKKYHSALQATTASHCGEILNDYGDGSLCTFASAIEAMQAALELQEKLRQEPAVPLRIGVHVGEIFFEDGKVFGDGVNIASRIQSLGQSNIILFSAEINNKIRNRPEFSSVSLGNFEFKNVNDPIEIFALTNPGLVIPKKESMTGKLKEAREMFSTKKLLVWVSIAILVIAGVFVYLKLQHRAKFTGREKSIAVLPFINMSTDKENEYFSDGMTEELTTQLSKIAELKVIARTSAMLYKGSTKSIKQIAEELGVSVVLEGSVQKAGNSIRITAQLINASTQEHIWADKYDRDFKDVFAIQSEVATAIAYQLNAKLTTEERRKLEQAPTNNTEAYQYYLQGNQLHNKFWETKNPELFNTGRIMLEKAIMLDPNYALAYASLADLYNSYTNIIKKDSQLLSLQLDEISKAWNIDSTNDYVVSVKGVIEETTSGNKETGFYYQKKAVELNPNNASNLWNLGLFIGVNFGLIDESLLLFDRAVKLDPLAANNFSFRGLCNWIMNNPEKATKDLETAMQLNPEYVGAGDALAHLYAYYGRLEEAKRLIEKSFTLKPSLADHWLPDVAYPYAKFGDKKKALELAPKDWGVLLALGMKEAAIKEMPFYNETDKRSSSEYLSLKFQIESKDFEPIKNDPRFLKILESNKKKYEENKSKYGVMDIISRFPSSTP